MLAPVKRRLALDIEVYKNYFLVKFKSMDTGISRSYALWPGQPMNVAQVKEILANFTVVTFNGNNFDIPVLLYALSNYRFNATERFNDTESEMCQAIKMVADWIIVGEHAGWEVYEQFNVARADWIDHIDLIEVAPGDGSLKLYGGRLHSRRLQDLPIEPDAHIRPDQRVVLDDYCGNDLDTTIDLYNELKPQIELRENMSKMYQADLRSKSDAQIAEVVIRSQITKLLGQRVSKPYIPAGTRFRYVPPAFLRYRTEQLKLKLVEIAMSEFVIDKNGSPIEPPALDGAVIRMGSSEYRMGIGGLHSSETCTSHVSDENTIIVDADVASYYPNIILNCGLYPKHLTAAFLDVYKDIVQRRLAAKRAGDKVTDLALKITINGSFGKFGSKYSVLYAPDLMIQVTVTGQLALLMLIETLELDGISVVSANTDGIVIKTHPSRKADIDRHIAEWQTLTGFEMEQTHYRAIYSRDVNNYMAVKVNGDVKGKGAYASVSLSKNPQNTICTEAVKAFLSNGTPIGQTIIGCRDIRKFLTVRTVKGGAVKITKTQYDDSLKPSAMREVLLANGWLQTVPGPLSKAKFDYIPDGCGYDVETAYRMHCGEDEFDYIGKVVRWYYATGVSGALHYKNKNKSGNRNKVPNSDGAKPLMELTDEFPSDVDYGYYIQEAHDILKSIGAM